MEKYILVYLVWVSYTIQRASGNLDAAKQLEEVLKRSPACKQIKCPPVTDPLCTRLKYVTSALEAKTVHVVMINRCEMKYISCYEGVEAKELPMVYCDHGKNISTDIKKIQERRRKRVEINVTVINQGETRKENSNNLTTPVAKLKIRRKREIVSKKKRASRRRRVGVNKTNISKKDEELSHINAVKRQLFEMKPSIQKSGVIKKLRKLKKLRYRGYSTESNELQNVEELPKLIHVYVKDEDRETLKNTDGNEKSEIMEQPSDQEQKTTLNKKDNDGEKLKNSGGNENVGIYTEPNDDYDDEKDKVNINPEVTDISDREDYRIESDDDKLEEVNMEQYRADCPTTCPARGVMLCGRCKDGIYRTFLSDCHMRMFDCGHPEEKLTLVSRHPCAMSGPYLDDLQVNQGRIDEPHDEDVVLRFLRCKEYANKKLRPYSKLNCTFDETM